MEEGKKAKIKSSFMRIHVAKRSMIYVVRAILIVIFGILLCVLAFFTAERMSNLYILSTEGMSLRADYVLGTEKDISSLQEYFLTPCLEKDSWLFTDRYNNYTITSYGYKLDIESISVLPWNSTAEVTATEDVSIKGSINESSIEEGKLASDYPVPEWEGGRYVIHYINDGTRWYISELELKDSNPERKAENTPDLSKSILPMATPTPTVELFDLK